jgi:metal transporter CNNM
MGVITWVGILFCISQAGMFSGLNLAFFSVGRLRLEVESARGSPDAKKVLALRKDANFLLTTILWGNVSVNVLLALISGSVLSGVAAFLFSTVLITLLGEILPQAVFSRYAVRSASFFAPVLQIYQVLLYPVAKPAALILDRWLGPEAISFFQEKDFHHLIQVHIESEHSDIGKVEGTGAINFLALDDIPVVSEGEIIDPRSILTVQFKDNMPVFPSIAHSPKDPFLRKIQASRMKWVILVNAAGEPCGVLNADKFIRDALFEKKTFAPYHYCHRPIVIRDEKTRLGETILRLRVYPTRADDDVVDQDIILYWTSNMKRIITGSDILGRLLRGIARQEKKTFTYLA